jgi:hypothetical protein
MPKSKRTVVVGDVHGQFESLILILNHAGLITEKGDWAGSEDIFIQIGDVIDRGPDSLDCYNYLKQIQKQALKKGGAVVRLCGNHELNLLQGDYGEAKKDIKNPEKVAGAIKKDVLSGDIKAAHTDGCWLFTHAGLRSEVRKLLLKEMGSNVKDVDLVKLVGYINDRFVSLVKKGELEGHPLLWVDPKRGGNDKVGGIFWGDWSLISPSVQANEIPQVFGHTPTGNKEINVSLYSGLINIDTGLCFGGNLSFLEITADGVLFRHMMKNKKWTSSKIETEINRTQSIKMDSRKPNRSLIPRRKTKGPEWSWSLGEVNTSKDHFKLKYFSSSEDQNGHLVALIGKPVGQNFTVKILEGEKSLKNNKMVKAALKEIDYYLINKGETDPWRYAIYHCGTSSNLYSEIRWMYFPTDKDLKGIKNVQPIYYVDVSNSDNKFVGRFVFDPLSKAIVQEDVTDKKIMDYFQQSEAWTPQGPERVTATQNPIRWLELLHVATGSQGPFVSDIKKKVISYNRNLRTENISDREDE